MRRWLRAGSKASTTVEFAVVGGMLCLVTFGIVETGLLWWLKSGMQLTASLTARCGAIGYTYPTAANVSCTSTSTTQNYAVNTSQNWLFPNMITANNVTVTPRATGTACNSAPGNYFSVSITSGFFRSLPPPLGNYTSLQTTACYPMQ